MIQSAPSTLSQIGETRDASTDSIYAALVNRIYGSASSLTATGHGSTRALRVGLTSCSRGEGVSTIACNLARFCAEVLQFETLLVDVSFGNSHYERLYQLEKPTVGIRQVLSSQAYLFSTIQSSPIDKLHYLPGGVGADKPFSPFVLKKFADVLTQLNHSFQIVILDLPPAGGMATGIPVANQLDAVVLVVQAGKTKKAEASAVSKYMVQSGVNVVGALANQTENELPDLTGLAQELAAMSKDGANHIWQLAKIAVNKCRQLTQI